MRREQFHPVFIAAVTLLSSLNIWSDEAMSGFLTVSHVQQTSRVTGIIVFFFSSSTERKSCTTTAMMGSTAVWWVSQRSKAPWSVRLKHIAPWQWLQLDSADRGCQSRVLVSSIGLVFNFAALVLALVLEIPIWTALETRKSGCRREF